MEMDWIAQSQAYSLVVLPERTVRNHIKKSYQQKLSWVKENSERKGPREPQYLVERSQFLEYARKNGWAVRRTVAISAPPENAQPLAAWHGEVKTTAQAALAKGRCTATIRRWCKAGKLNFIRQGRRYLVCVDEKYKAITQTQVASLRQQIGELEAEIAKLRAQIKTQQLEFALQSPTMDIANSVVNMTI